MSVFRRHAVRAVLGLLVAATSGAACGDSGGGAGPSTTVTTTTAAPTTTVTPTTTAAPTTIVTPTTTAPQTVPGLVYLVRGEHLAAASRDLPSGPDRLRAAIQAVVAGPSAFESAEAGLSTQVPAGTAVLGVTFAGGTATIDLSSRFESGGGSLSMRLRVAELVYTATEQPGVARVMFALDGRPVVAIGGEGVLVDGVDRSTFEDLLPPILVQQPTPGARVTRSITVSGLANVFEGTVSIQVRDATGAVLAEGFGTGAMGEWLSFSATVVVPPTASGPLVVRCYEASAEDGSPRNIIDVPVELVGG
jgi:hypothetical protein